jgi:glycerol-3-phosphate dehydrogenase (NAD(P)+)
VHVRLWARTEHQRAHVVENVPGVVACKSVAEACDPSALVLFAVPTHALVEVAAAFGPVARGDHIVLHAARGVSAGFMLPHQSIRHETCVKKIGVLGGPLYLDDARNGRPLAAVVASRFDETFDMVRRITAGTPVRMTSTHDLVGVEVAGALSHVSALALGIAQGLGLGDTDQGLLLTRGLQEASRIGVHLGADPATFTGLAGVGDLSVPRRVTSTRKHKDFGHHLGEGKPTTAHDATLEGVITAREAAELAHRAGLDLPLLCAIDDIVRGRVGAGPALERVLQLPLELPHTSSSSAMRGAFA